MRKKSRHPPPSAKHSREIVIRNRKLTSDVETSPSLSAFRLHRPSLSLSRSSLLNPSSIVSQKSHKHSSIDADQTSSFLDFGALHRQLLDIKAQLFEESERRKELQFQLRQERERQDESERNLNQEREVKKELYEKAMALKSKLKKYRNLAKIAASDANESLVHKICQTATALRISAHAPAGTLSEECFGQLFNALQNSLKELLQAEEQQPSDPPVADISADISVQLNQQGSPLNRGGPSRQSGNQLIGEVVDSLRKELQRVRFTAQRETQELKVKEKETEDLKRMVQMHQMRGQKSAELLSMYKKAYEQAKTNSKLLKKKVKEAEDKFIKSKEQHTQSSKQTEQMQKVLRTQVSELTERVRDLEEQTEQQSRENLFLSRRTNQLQQTVNKQENYIRLLQEQRTDREVISSQENSVNSSALFEYRPLVYQPRERERTSIGRYLVEQDSHSPSPIAGGKLAPRSPATCQKVMEQPPLFSNSLLEFHGLQHLSAQHMKQGAGGGPVSCFEVQNPPMNSFKHQKSPSAAQQPLSPVHLTDDIASGAGVTLNPNQSKMLSTVPALLRNDLDISGQTSSAASPFARAYLPSTVKKQQPRVSDIPSLEEVQQALPLTALALGDLEEEECEGGTVERLSIPDDSQSQGTEMRDASYMDDDYRKETLLSSSALGASGVGQNYETFAQNNLIHTVNQESRALQESPTPKRSKGVIQVLTETQNLPSQFSDLQLSLNECARVAQVKENCFGYGRGDDSGVLQADSSETAGKQQKGQAQRKTPELASPTFEGDRSMQAMAAQLQKSIQELDSQLNSLKLK